MGLIPFTYGWGTLVIAIVVLANRRMRIARRLHVAQRDAALVTQQEEVARDIRTIDTWGQWLTVVAVLYGLALLEIYLRSIWIAGVRLPA